MKGFRTFLLRGNVVDLAVGIVVGAAFTSVVNGFVRAFLTPLVGLAVGASGDFSDQGFKVGKVEFPVGAFLTAIVTFILVALFVYYLVVLPVNALTSRFSPKNEVTTPKRDCPECLSSVPTEAKRCAFCTSELVPV
ncbi:large conductance mechanosensitive channel protein MscL [Nocardia aurantia]|uniref:Large-conductance mechanosensitive channel n=1 Tax=Nocardia aurantia TaxID=2585199 RepID=A0A7K0DZY3_9NOCA|nr:large conductance mechanosensitive channel protein MscL [Nocardia aurantia]MQY30832.1 Large-conductance mechanosensitive channel [Nocardia aurantia]